MSGGLKPYKAAPEYHTTKDIVRRLVDTVGGVDFVGGILQRKSRIIYDYCDRDSKTQMTFDQVRIITMATGAKAHGAVEALAADAGGVFLPGEVSEEAFGALAARLCNEQGQFSAAVCSALSDGKIEPDEVPDVLRELDDVIRLAIAARGRLLARERA